jgi:general secretion pathway protein I
LFGPRHLEATRSRAGFTLIEVLVALAVVAIVLPSIGKLLATNIKGTVKVEQRAKLLSAYRTLETGFLDRSGLLPGMRTGEFGATSWTVEISDLAEDGAAPSPNDIWVPRLIVTNLRSNSGETLRVETIRLARR